MAEPLKSRYGAEVPRTIARMIRRVHPGFPARAFVTDVLQGYEALELMARAGRICECMQRHLPADYSRAIRILVDSLGPQLAGTAGHGMAPFLYLPHVLFVARYGLEHFAISMQAQHALTRRFTAEFSLRAYIERHPQRTLAVLRAWARDPNPHVRRLVSEGTRPRLPWAPHLRAFWDDPRPIIELLEVLKDDPDPYVRRSVANHLNDIGKDHPRLLVATARTWLREASDQRRALVRHALRSAVKRGERAALALLGYGESVRAEVRNFAVVPRRVPIGSRVAIGFDLVNLRSRSQRWLVDLRVHYVKADGSRSPKVFKLRTFDVAPNGSVRIEKTLSLAQLTTRKHYAGEHAIEVLVNGQTLPVGGFRVTRVASG